MVSADIVVEGRPGPPGQDQLRAARAAAERLAARSRSTEVLLERAKALLADAYVRCAASVTARGRRDR